MIKEGGPNKTITLIPMYWIGKGLRYEKGLSKSLFLVRYQYSITQVLVVYFT